MCVINWTLDLCKLLPPLAATTPPLTISTIIFRYSFPIFPFFFNQSSALLTCLMRFALYSGCCCRRARHNCNVYPGARAKWSVKAAPGGVWQCLAYSWLKFLIAQKSEKCIKGRSCNKKTREKKEEEKKKRVQKVPQNCNDGALWQQYAPLLPRLCYT